MTDTRSLPPKPPRHGTGVGADDCPPPETLAAYLDGGLDGAMREQVEDHVSRCEDCYFVVRETGMAQAEMEEARPRRNHLLPPRLSGLLPIAATLVLGVGSFVVWKHTHPPDPYAEAVAPLVEAVGKRRFFEARLVGGFEYGPLVPSRRGPAGAPGKEDWRLLSAAARVRTAVESERSADRVRALAAAHQLLGEADEAVRLLQRLVEEAPNPRDMSDLAAAFLATASESEGLALAKALEAASQAVEKDPNLPEALFNRSLALERLGLRSQAIESWQAFLRVEPAGGWAQEAKRHLEALSAQSGRNSSDFEQQLRKALSASDTPAMRRVVSSQLSWAWDLWEGKLLEEWAAAPALGEARSQLNALGKVIAECARDASLLPGDSPNVARGIAAYVRGRRLYEMARWSESQAVLEDASNDLVGCAPFQWVRLYQGILAYQQGRLDDATRLLDGVVAMAARHQWPMLSGRSHWAHGVLLARQGRFDTALENYALASRHFAQVGAREHEGYVAHIAAEALDLIGCQREAWSERRKALLAVAGFRQHRRRFGVFLVAASFASEQGFPRLGWSFMQEADPDFVAHGDASDWVQFLLRKAALQPGVDGASTRALLERARRLAASIDDVDARDMFQEEVLIAEALAAQPADRPASSLDEAITRLLTRGEEARLPDLLFARAFRRASLSQWASASEDVERAFQAFRHTKALDPARRSDYWRQTEIRMPHLVDAALASAQPDVHTLLQSERARTLWYHERALRQGETETLFGSVLRQLEPGDVGLWFFEGEKHRAVIVMSVGRYDVVGLVGGPGGPRRMRDRAVQAAASRDERELVLALEGLWKLMVKPLSSYIAGARRLLIVPSSSTLAVPFAALRNPSTGRFLVEDFDIEAFPSLSAVGQAGNGRAPTRVLFLRGLEGAGDAHLAAIGREYEELRDLYGRRLFKTMARTREGLVQELGGADVVHFSGHVRSSQQYPGLSSFRVALGAGGLIVFAHEMQPLRMRAGALVVMNGCRSAGDSLLGDGNVGFVRPFILAGARVVLASAWDVFDDAAAAIVVPFHKAYAAGQPPDRSLALAQREMIHRKEPVWAWGGYGVYSSTWHR